MSSIFYEVSEFENLWPHLETLKPMGSDQALDGLLQLLFTTKRDNHQKSLHMLLKLTCINFPHLRRGACQLVHTSPLEQLPATTHSSQMGSGNMYHNTQLRITRKMLT